VTTHVAKVLPSSVGTRVHGRTQCPEGTTLSTIRTAASAVVTHDVSLHDSITLHCPAYFSF
jgi:hypothetical protein